MNVINHYRLLLLCLLFWVACSKQLDVAPRQSIASEVALSSDQGVKSALVGAYDLLSNASVWGGGQVASELMANDADQIWTGTFREFQQIFSKSISVQNATVDLIWQMNYRVINAVNNILASIAVVDLQDQTIVEAEARFIRAAAYFDLINLFSKTWMDGDPMSNLGVPLITQPTQEIGKDLQVPRSFVQAVYDLIIIDLQYARDQLPEDNGIFASKNAAHALLSRVYLMQHEYQLALEEVTFVINSGLFDLVADFDLIYNQSFNTSEDIFAMQNTAQDKTNDFITFYAGENAGGRGDIAITDEHLDKYALDDRRRELFYFDDFGVRRTGKWRDNSSQDGNIGIIRLSEMYLTSSECHFMLGDLDLAANDLNRLRSRAALSSLLPDEISLEIILQERALELAFEGHLFRDLKRNQKNVGDLTFQDDRLVFPIPQRELDVNPMLSQNPGY